jgi:hypothetical protein
LPASPEAGFIFYGLGFRVQVQAQNGSGEQTNTDSAHMRTNYLLPSGHRALASPADQVHCLAGYNSKRIDKLRKRREIETLF